MTGRLGYLQLAVEAVGTLAFFASGLMSAARRRLDVVGTFSLAGLAGFGGGTLRDVLLDRRPFTWVQHWGWLVVLMVLTVFVRRLPPLLQADAARRWIQWADALGLGLFAASGTQIAAAAGMPALVAALMGAMTAVCGGILRDIACAEVPTAFSDHRPYAICALAGGAVVLLSDAAGRGGEAALLVGGGVAVVLRAAAIVWDVRLPGWRAPTD